MKSIKTDKIFPTCYSFILFSIFFILPLFIVPGIYLIINGISINISLIIFGAILIALPVIAIPLFYKWLRSLLMIEFKDSYFIYNNIDIPAKMLHRNIEEISYLGLSSLIIINKKTYNLIYTDGSQKTINLKSFGKKQRIVIKLEILKRACHINGYAMKEENL